MMISIKNNFKAFLWGGFFLMGLASIGSCQKEEPKPFIPVSTEDKFIRAADLSAWPKINAAGLQFYTADSIPGNFLDILQNQGLNTVRLRLWVKPEDRHHSFAQVDSFAQVLKSRGLKVWLCVHLSDTWADPGHQEVPATWSNLNFQQLKDSLYNYIYRVNQQIKPEILQIGNEINPGFLLPYGDRWASTKQYLSLLDTAIIAARASYSEAKIMIHYACIDAAAQDFYRQIDGLDYDIIGLSYYPIWHGKSITALKNRFIALSQEFEQDLMIAETAYPFTLGWNDWTNNIMGQEDQLVPTFPASPAGQKHYMVELREIMENNPQGLGFGYWGGELIAWKGPQGQNASPFENQALFNFNNVALPVQEVFNP